MLRAAISAAIAVTQNVNKVDGNIFDCLALKLHRKIKSTSHKREAARPQ
jgi:hypothetical protein